MQTFLPHPDFSESAAVLDSKRLNKQLLEGRQVYGILSSGRTTGGWVRHPAVLMWKGYHTALYRYLEAIKDECVARGIQTDKNWNAILEMRKWDYGTGINLVMPPWWNDERVHRSHRNNLYRKDPVHYAKFADAEFVSCCDRCNYLWPSHLLMYNAELLEPFQYVKV